MSDELAAIRARWADSTEDLAVFPNDFVEIEMSPRELALWESAPADIQALLARVDTLDAVVATLRDVLAGNLSTSALRVALAGLDRPPGGTP